MTLKQKRKDSVGTITYGGVLSVDIVEEFKAACQAMKVTQRSAIEEALKDFVTKYSQANYGTIELSSQ